MHRSIVIDMPLKMIRKALNSSTESVFMLCYLLVFNKIGSISKQFTREQRRIHVLFSPTATHNRKVPFKTAFAISEKRISQKEETQHHLNETNEYHN